MAKEIWITPHQKVPIGRGNKSLHTEIASRDRAEGFGSYFGYLPNPDPVLKKRGQDISVYKELRTDSHVFSQILSRKSGLRSMEWEIDRGKAKTKETEFINDIFTNVLKMNRIISGMLEAPLYGYKFMEIMWEKRGEYLVCSDVVGKPPQWFNFDTENRPRFKTMGSLMGELLPDKKFLIPTFEADYENPYGFASLSACFWSVVFKRGGMKFWATFTEKYSMPFLLGKTPRGTSKEENQALLESLDEMIQDAVAVIPDDSSVEVITGSDKGSSDIYYRLCQFCNGEISKALLGQTLTTEVGDNGSYAAGKVHEGVRADIIESDADMVTEQLNQLIRWLIDFNFANVNAYPEIIFYYPKDVDKDLADRDSTLTTQGVRFNKKYYSRAYGLDDDEFDVVDVADPGQPAAEFAEPVKKKNTDVLDDAAAGIKSLTAESEAEIDMKLAEILNSASDYDEAIEALMAAYPKLNLERVQEMTDRLGFNSFMLGFAEAEEEQ